MPLPPKNEGGRGLKPDRYGPRGEMCIVLLSGVVVSSETKKNFVARNQAERLAHYSSKALHGYFVGSCDKNFDKTTSFYWLSKGGLTFETEGLLLATQNQTLCTNAMQHIYYNHFSSQWCLCHGQA